LKYNFKFSAMKMKAIDCLNCSNTDCLIKKHSLDSGIESFLEQKKTIQSKKGQNIIIEGSPVHGLYFILNGKVKVYNSGINGREQIHRFAKNGEMIGQRGFSSHQHYPVGAVTIEDTLLCHFSFDIIKKILHTLPLLTYDFMTFFAEELFRSETKVRKFAHMTVREKVIDALLYFNRKFGLKNGFLNIGLSRKDIADFAGTTEEQVIRILSALKKENLITTVGKKIGISNPEHLKKEIDEHHFFIQS
jgi:CRP/FNR family transcriptional regulator, anaerobic regulatory protein